MKVINEKILINSGSIQELEEILNTIRLAIEKVVWPIGSHKFSLNPQRKKNGVRPIKNACMEYLLDQNWEIEKRLDILSSSRPGPLDAALELSDGTFFAVEWETGNISSSHRALNKMCLGLLNGMLSGGVLILPSRGFYQYLTDRIGNYLELKPYFPVWQQLSINGFLAIFEIEYDALDDGVPLIPKGSDGMAPMSMLDK